MQPQLLKCWSFAALTAALFLFLTPAAYAAGSSTSGAKPAAQVAPLWSEDFSTITPGNIVGTYGSGNPPDSQTMKDLEARGWSGEGHCPTYYCPGAVVVIPGPTGASVHALRYRYEEGPDSANPDAASLEVKLGLETSFFPGNPLAVNGGLKEVYVRYYLQTQPVPADTPACTPNCPTTSSVNNVATKQHYWRAEGESGGPTWGSFVPDFMFGSKELEIGYQQATDCPFDGIFDCPILYQNVNHVSIDDNRWYCVEYHWKDNTVSPKVLANGVMQMWIDGVPVISSVSRQWDDATHQTALDNFVIYRQSGGYQWRFETDLVIDNKPIPCLDGWTPPPPPPSQAGTMGETALGPTTDSGHVGTLLAQKVNLKSPGTLKSLSFYVQSGAGGSMHLAVYNDIGDRSNEGGAPGILLAKTADFAVVNGWNTQPVTTQVDLQAGTYWLVYEYTDPNVQALGFGSGTYLGVNHSWGALPTQWGIPTSSGANQWSFYATLGVSGTSPPPVQLASPTGLTVK